jgi:hypothetical protein
MAIEIYSLSGLNQIGTTNPFRLVTGSGTPTSLAYRAGWKVIEPSEGVYNWSAIDGALAAVQAIQTNLSISVKAGADTPGWVYSAGALAFSFSWERNYEYPKGSIQRCPYPWDATYLAKFAALIAALGARYGAEAAVDHFALEGINSYTQETLLPRDPTNNGATAQWAAAGYTNALIESASATLMGNWAGTGKKFAGMHGPGFLPKLPVDDTPTLINQAVAGYPNQYIAMNNALGGTPPWLWSEITALQGQCEIGWQMLDAQGANVVACVDAAAAAGGTFVEVYRRDLAYL